MKLTEMVKKRYARDVTECIAFSVGVGEVSRQTEKLCDGGRPAMSKGHSQKAKEAERGARSAPFAKLFGLTDTPLQRKVFFQKDGKLKKEALSRFLCQCKDTMYMTEMQMGMDFS